MLQSSPGDTTLPEYGDPEDQPQSATAAAKRRRRLALVRATERTRNPRPNQALAMANRLKPAKLEAAYRQEPLLRRGITKWSGAVVRDWFHIVDTDGELHEMDADFQSWARGISLKAKLKESLVWSRVYGDGLLEYEWDDASNSDQGIPESAALLNVHVIDPVTAELREVRDDNGAARIMLIQTAGSEKITVHPDRVRHFVIDSLAGRIRGLSAIEVAFHNAISKIQGDQAAGEILFHAGLPHKHIQIPDAEDEEIEFFTNMLKDPKFSRGVATDSEIDITQLEPATIDPAPFYSNFRESIAAAIGIPEMMLRGAQAGQVTGSETNIGDFHDDISEVRENVMDSIVESIVIGATHLEPGEFDIRWNPFPVDLEKKGRTWREISNAVSVLVNSIGMKKLDAFKLLGIDNVTEEMFEDEPEGVLPVITRAER